MDYFQKYIKYKNKFLKLKLDGGANKNYYNNNEEYEIENLLNEGPIITENFRIERIDGIIHSRLMPYFLKGILITNNDKTCEITRNVIPNSFTFTNDIYYIINPRDNYNIINDNNIMTNGPINTHFEINNNNIVVTNPQNIIKKIVYQISSSNDEIRLWDIINYRNNLYSIILELRRINNTSNQHNIENFFNKYLKFQIPDFIRNIHISSYLNIFFYNNTILHRQIENNIPYNHYIVCILNNNFYDFQLGLSETQKYEETIENTCKRGIYEETRILFNGIIPAPIQRNNNNTVFIINLCPDDVIVEPEPAVELSTFSCNNDNQHKALIFLHGTIDHLTTIFNNKVHYNLKPQYFNNDTPIFEQNLIYKYSERLLLISKQDVLNLMQSELR